MGIVKIAAAAVSENIVSRAERIGWLIEAAKEGAEKGADIVVFPEGCLSHRTKEGIKAYEEEKDSRTLARAADHPEIEKFRQAARKNNVMLLMNTEELERGKVYNTTFFFSSKGELIGRYRKHFLAPGEEKTFQPGRYMRPVRTPFGCVAVIICWEIHFPDLCVRHLLEGADFFIWQTMPFGDMAMGAPNRVAARAADLARPFIVATYALPDERASTWDGISTMAADAFGRVTGATPQKPGVYVFEIDTDQKITMTPWGEPPEKSFDRRVFIARQREEGPVVKGV